MILHSVLMRCPADLPKATIAALRDGLHRIRTVLPGMASVTAGRSESPEQIAARPRALASAVPGAGLPLDLLPMGPRVVRADAAQARQGKGPVSEQKRKAFTIKRYQTIESA